MARIRTIKPEFWEDEKIAILPYPCRLLFIGTWNHADDNGVIRGNPSILKSKIFPYDDNLRVSEVSKWLDALVNARMLVPISYKNESYFVIRTFHSHQKFDARYPNYLIPNEEFDILYSPNENPTRTQREPDENPTWEGEREREEIRGNNIPPISPKGDEKDRIDFNSFMDYFNQTFKDKLSAVTSMTDKRKKAIKSRLAEHGKESIRIVYKNILLSPFLLGNNDKNWKCDFNWIFKPDNYIKILEGNYNAQSNNSIQPAGNNSFGGTPANKAASRDALEQLADAILEQHSTKNSY